MGECHFEVGQLLFDERACHLLWHVHELMSVPGSRAGVCAWHVEYCCRHNSSVYNIHLEWYNVTCWHGTAPYLLSRLQSFQATNKYHIMPTAAGHHLSWL